MTKNINGDTDTDKDFLFSAENRWELALLVSFRSGSCDFPGGIRGLRPWKLHVRFVEHRGGSWTAGGSRILATMSSNQVDATARLRVAGQ